MVSYLITLIHFKIDTLLLCLLRFQRFGMLPVGVVVIPLPTLQYVPPTHIYVTTLKTYYTPKVVKEHSIERSLIEK